MDRKVPDRSSASGRDQRQENPEASVSRAELDDALRSRGVEPLSDGRLRRLRNAMLVRTVAGIPDGRRGRPQLRYTPDSVDVLDAIHKIGAKLDLDELAFELWWQGLDVPIDTVRGFVTRRLDGEVAEIRDLAEIHADPYDFADALDTELRQDNALPRSPQARLIVSRLGGDMDDARALLYNLALLFSGARPDFDAGDDPDKTERTPREIFTAGLGLDRATTEGFAETGPRVDEMPDVAELFYSIADADPDALTTPGKEISSASDEQLIAARDLAHHLLSRLGFISARLEAVGGRDVFGFGDLAVMHRREGSMITRIQMLRTCLVIPRFTDPDVLGELVADIAENLPQFAQLDEQTEEEKRRIAGEIRAQITRSEPTT